MDSRIKSYKLWKVKNGWLALTDRTSVPDGFDCRGYDMQSCTVHHSLRAFADYISNQERQAAAAATPIKFAKRVA